MEMHKDINNLDTEDFGLKGIFGDRFEDATTEKPEAVKTTRKAENPAKKVKAPAIEPKYEPKDAQWMPCKPEPNFYDRLKDCAKWVSCCGGLSMLFFYWEQTGQMLHSAAFPSIVVCTLLAGFGIGKNTIKR